MTFSNTHLKSIEIETERRLSAKTKFDPYAKSLWDNALNSAYLDDNLTMQKAYSFAKRLEYKHKGLTKDVYFSHPLRVSSLSVLFNDLVMSEIIMRLFAVFQQNVDDNCSKWNNVIPSLLLHLRESRLLFV
jgi:hypothetical protein